MGEKYVKAAFLPCMGYMVGFLYMFPIAFATMLYIHHVPCPWLQRQYMFLLVIVVPLPTAEA